MPCVLLGRERIDDVDDDDDDDQKYPVTLANIYVHNTF